MYNYYRLTKFQGGGLLSLRLRGTFPYWAI